MAKGKIDNITLGRTDLSASYMDKNITPDCDFITSLVEKIGRKTREAGLSFTVGGSICANTLSILNEKTEISNLIEAIETRKVVLETESFLHNENALNEALYFEEIYIMSKKEISDLMIESEISRLSKLSGRR